MPSTTENADAPVDAVAAVLARLEAGDAGVTARDLLAAESAERFAAARAEAARRKDAADAEQARRDRIAALVEGIPRDLDPAPIAAARAELAEALDRFVGVCRAHDARFADATDALLDPSLAPLPPGLGVDGVSVRTIDAGGRSFRRAPTQRTIREAATEAIGTHYGPRQMVDLGRPND